MDSKFYLYQIIAIAIIWGGMAFFFQELYTSGKVIFYVVTSWLLFLIVGYIRSIVEKRKQNENNDST